MRDAPLSYAVTLCASMLCASSSVAAQSSPSPGAQAPISTASRSDSTPPAQSALTPPARRTLDGLPTLRFAFGVGSGDAANGVGDTDFAFDAAVGAWMTFAPGDTGLHLWPELGYASDSSDLRGGRYATAGVGIMYGSEWLSAGVAPRFLVGDADGRLGMGLRSSLVVQAAFTALSLEVGHQWMRVDGSDLQEFRATLSLNPLSMLFALVMVAGGSIVRGGVSAAGNAVGIR